MSLAHQARPSGDVVEWLILSEQGDPVASVSLPSGLDVQAVDMDTAWGRELDDFDVPYIVRYRVTRSGGGR